MIRRHNTVWLLALLLAGFTTFTQAADVYVTLEEAPRTVFPEADKFERKDVKSGKEFQRRIKELIGRSKPSIWEPFYITFIARKNDKVIGYAVVCEEIGKHRPITFITAVTPEGKVKDVAVMMYREAYGGEVRYHGFTKQFRDKGLQDPITARRDIRNISGATLSTRAMARGVRKALAVIQLAYLNEEEEKP